MSKRRVKEFWLSNNPLNFHQKQGKFITVPPPWTPSLPSAQHSCPTETGSYLLVWPPRAWILHRWGRRDPFGVVAHAAAPGSLPASSAQAQPSTCHLFAISKPTPAASPKQVHGGCHPAVPPTLYQGLQQGCSDPHYSGWFFT